MDNYDGLLLASGGMDSTVLSYDLNEKGENILLLFLDYGQHCMKQEYDTLLQVVPETYREHIKVLNISDIYFGSNSRMIKEADLWKEQVVADDLYLPYRNLLFISIASAFAQSKGIKKVYSAFINSNHAKEIDCSMQFFTELEMILRSYGSIKLCMPYREMSKTQVAKLGLKLGAPICLTYSCQVNSHRPCGACPNCVDRIEALNNVVLGRE
jgi:queuosine biosynthesis protein QueC